LWVQRPPVGHQWRATLQEGEAAIGRVRQAKDRAPWGRHAARRGVLSRRSCPSRYFLPSSNAPKREVKPAGATQDPGSWDARFWRQRLRLVFPSSAPLTFTSHVRSFPVNAGKQTGDASPSPTGSLTIFSHASKHTSEPRAAHCGSPPTINVVARAAPSTSLTLKLNH
jgi:hypothetical protein